MEEAIVQLQAKDRKERMAGVERLQTTLEQSRKVLSANEVGNLVDTSLMLLKDNNFRVSQGTLQALASAAALAGEHLKLHFNSLLPAIVERLGDSKQPVRDAGRQLLLALMEISSPTIIVERAGNVAWTHKNWRVREEFARTVASAINLFAATELPFQRMLLPSVLQLLEDSNNSVREAAMLCLEELYRLGTSQFKEELQRHRLRSTQLKDITCRFDKIEPVWCSIESTRNPIALTNESRGSGQFVTSEHKPSLPAGTVRRNSPRVKVDGSIGGATEYACFMQLMKQLVGPLTVQLSDRRSSIVKQTCHLLNLMSRELLGDFEMFAESFIPVLFKLVIITVLVIAESADTCIKTMLQNCRVSRVLPKLMECAKHDRNAVLRARCCEYALLVLEQWGDSSEIQRSVELYEELIKCCVGDAMSEVRSSARICYRLFSRYWPDRARRIFVTFDTSVQRLLNEEGSFQKRYASPSVRERVSCGQQQQLKQSANMPFSAISHEALALSAPSAYSSTTAVHTERSSGILSGLGALTMTNSCQRKSVELGPQRSLASVLHASQQQVNAIENMLMGVEISDKGAAWAAGKIVTVDNLSDNVALSTATGSSLRDPVGVSYRRVHTASVASRVGIDLPSARDPPYPAAAPVNNQSGSQGAALIEGITTLGQIQGSVSAGSGGVGVAGELTSHQVLHTQKELHSLCHDEDRSHLNVPGRFLGGSFTTGLAAKRVLLERHGPIVTNGYVMDVKGAKRILKVDDIEKLEMDSNDIPGFQRPLQRQSASGRSSGSSKSCLEDGPVFTQFSAHGENHNYMEGMMSLHDALTEGLSVSADWSVRVAAFTFLRKLLQKGPKGLQEINQYFALVMKLFSAHLDDPHHKVAHAALATLAELVPACCKSFESYLERILPHVFARLVDGKDAIRQLGATALEIVGNIYSVDLLLPALLRSLDQQRSPKAKMAVIEFAMMAFAKLALNSETCGGSGLLKLWLAKLGPLANDKNPKLKETAVTGIISVYSHFDSTTVLNFILGLSIEEQSVLRRSLKHYTPRIEVDLMTYIQNRSQRGRSRSVYDQPDTSSAAVETCAGPLRVAYSHQTSNHLSLGHVSNSTNSDDGRKLGSTQSDTTYTGSRLVHEPAARDFLQPYQSCESSGSREEIFSQLSSQPARTIEFSTRNGADGTDGRSSRSAVWLNGARHQLLPVATRHDHENSPLVDAQSSVDSEQWVSAASPEFTQMTQLQSEPEAKYGDPVARKTNHEVPSQNSDLTVPNIVFQMMNWSNSRPAWEIHEALQQLLTMQCGLNDTAVWSQFFPQILKVILDLLGHTDGEVKELALSVIFKALENQGQALNESTEVLLEKILCLTSDLDLKVCSAADRCLTLVLTELDPYRCLMAVVPLLFTEDEKLLVTYIGSLTKLVRRLQSEELTAQLASFLPALFDAFGNRNADVRKTVVFCLVEIYIVLGSAFVPYLGNLSSTQRRLVTIYANRISQARLEASLDTPQP